MEAELTPEEAAAMPTETAQSPSREGAHASNTSIIRATVETFRAELRAEIGSVRGAVQDLRGDFDKDVQDRKEANERFNQRLFQALMGFGVFVFASCFSIIWWASDQTAAVRVLRSDVEAGKIRDAQFIDMANRMIRIETLLEGARGNEIRRENVQ